MADVLPFPDRRPRAATDPEPRGAALRAVVERAVQSALDTADRLFRILDQWDGDADLEPDTDDEPSLGAPEGDGSQLIWLRGGDADREQDHHPVS